MRLTIIPFLVCLACDSSTSTGVAASGATSPEVPSPEAPQPAPSPPLQVSRDTEPAQPRMDGSSDCRFQRPTAWEGGEVTWLGSCKGGFAEGNGVLVNAVEGAEPERFYGRLERGSPSVGVLQADGGFMAGRWANGAIAEALADDVAQRNVLIDAFRVAAAAATAVSQSSGKTDAEEKSFYAKQARLLRDQMD
jgi:hypothetical protein